MKLLGQEAQSYEMIKNAQELVPIFKGLHLKLKHGNTEYSFKIENEIQKLELLS